MSAKTLIEVSKPIIFTMNFMGYGFGWEKWSGRGKGLLEWALKINVALLLILYLTYSVAFLFAYNWICKGEYYLGRALVLLFGPTFLDYFLLINQTQLRKVIGQFESFPVAKESEKALKKCLRLFYCYLAINIIPFMAIFFWLFSRFFDPQTSFKIIISSVFYLWFFPSMFLLMLFPVFFCYFVCLVPVYCVARVRELAKATKSARSSWRRARMTSDLLRQCHRLKRLTSMTDESVSKAMSLFRLLFVLLLPLTVAMLDSDVKTEEVFTRFLLYSLCIAIFFVHVFPFLMYERIAPLANGTHSLIFEALVDIILIDDEWLSRETIVRPLLIKLRVLHVFEVTHLALEEASFRHFGEAIEGETLFTIFLDAFDVYNNITSHKRNLILSYDLSNFELEDYY